MSCNSEAGAFVEERLRCTLEALRGEGADALRTLGVEEIGRIELIGLVLAYDSSYGLTVEKRADDLFDCVAKDPTQAPLIPANAALVAAWFAFRVNGEAEVQIVEVRPPDTVRVGPGGYRKKILEWLAKGPLCRLNMLLVTGLLATAMAVAPGFDDNDGDEDDDEGEAKCVLRVSCCVKTGKTNGEWERGQT